MGKMCKAIGGSKHLSITKMLSDGEKCAYKEFMKSIESKLLDLKQRIMEGVI